MKIRFAALSLALGVSVFLPMISAKGQEDGALLDALVKKGVLSNQEATNIRADEQKEWSTTSASKIALTNSVKSLTFYGDGRLRFDELTQNYYNPTKNVQDRLRYRIRLGADYTYSDNLKAGFELESSTTDDSANQTLGATFTKASINVGRIYAQYQAADWLTLTGGKFANPWYETTDMVYSFDLNPEGAAEIYNFVIPLGGGSEGSSIVDPKDVKSVQAASAPDSSLTVGWNAVQYLYVTSNQSAVNGGFGAIQNNNNVGIIGNQIPVTWKINKNLTVKVAPGFTFYTGGGNTNFQGGVPANYTNNGTPPEPQSFYGTANSSSDPTFYSPKEADDLNVFSAPGEINFKIAGVPIRPYWDFDWNLTGKERVQDVYLSSGGAAASTSTFGAGSTYGFGSVPPNGRSAAAVQSQNQALGDNIAWAVGVQVGQNKKKGDASGLVEFRQIGLGSVDPNINGTDFANSYSNVEGLKFSAAYNFTDAFTGTVTFYDDWAYKNNLYKSLGGAGTATAPSAGTTQYLVSLKSVQRLQVDLGWKF